MSLSTLTLTVASVASHDNAHLEQTTSTRHVPATCRRENQYKLLFKRNKDLEGVTKSGLDGLPSVPASVEYLD